MNRTVLSLWHGRIPFVPGARDGQTLREIAEEVAAREDMTLATMRGPGQYRHVAHPRQEVMARAYEERWADGRRVYSLPQIGKFFNRDHTTVIHGIRAYAARQEAKTQ